MFFVLNTSKINKIATTNTDRIIYIYARLSIPFGFRVFYLFLKTIFKDKICLVTYLYAETGNKLKINIFIFGFMRILYGFNVVCFLVLV